MYAMWLSSSIVDGSSVTVDCDSEIASSLHFVRWIRDLCNFLWFLNLVGNLFQKLISILYVELLSDQNSRDNDKHIKMSLDCVLSNLSSLLLLSNMGAFQEMQYWTVTTMMEVKLQLLLSLPS
ncbi:hypothetical protein VNO77_41261 [Canavalia gladiata]|uniref:Uncharacterized protein n=1 Tax=Canavalia gladiata TaxID=3824 RepID=A0AAN9K0U3_CANGL